MSITKSNTAIIVGSGGGIGKALKNELLSMSIFKKVICFSKSNDLLLDITNKDEIEKTADELKKSEVKVNLLINAVGLLHNESFFPEKKISDIDPNYLVNSFKLNTIGHALIIKYFTPLFDKTEKSFLISLSARVGSITDNYLGGWFGYRASKAALNQIVKSASIELSRTKPNMILASIHPGTVYTKLSKPFIKETNCFSASESAKKILKTIFRLNNSDSGKLLDYEGKIIPF